MIPAPLSLGAPPKFVRDLLFLPEEASTVAGRIDALHFFIIGAALVVGTGIAIVTLTFLFKYSGKPRSTPTPAIKGPPWFEALYIGFPLLMFLVWFAIGFKDYVFAVTPPANAMDVYVSAKQWMWKFSYPEGPNAINELRVPAGRPVRLLITSRDVIHSFYVPAFRVKQDAVPGRYTQAWFQAIKPGTHAIFCAEYCGLQHSRMRAHVVVMDPKDYDQWVASEKAKLLSTTGPEGTRSYGPGATYANLRELGRKVAADKGCLKCHSVDGTAHTGPTWVGLYLRKERLDTGEEVVADEAYLTESMMDPGAKVVAGFQPVMPSFRGRLEPGETAALIEFIRALRERPDTERPPERSTP